MSKENLTQISKEFQAQIPDLFKEFSIKIQEAYNSIKKTNIIVIGKTGTGKSTLVNSIFRENLCKTGKGKPITQYIRLYQKDGVPVNIYDTPGMELNNIEKVKLDVINEINSNIKDVSKAIHIVWYCIDYQSSRIEDVEIDFIKTLSQKVKVVLVLTKDYFSDDNEFLQEIKKLNLSVENIIRVNSIAKGDKREHGLEVLVELTQQCLPDALKLGFASALSFHIEDFIAEKKYIAKKWIIAYCTGTFIEGFSPIPFSDIALMLSTQVGMLAHVTVIFGLSIERDILGTFISSVAGTTATGFMVRFLVGNLIKLFPFIGSLIGGIINGTIAATITAGIGLAYLSLLEYIIRKMVKNEPVSENEVDKIVQDEIKNTYVKGFNQIIPRGLPRGQICL